MEFIAYSSMVIANKEANGQAEYLEYELPKFNFSWGKLFKSSAWLSVAGLMVLFTTLTQVNAALGAYVRTNGSCLNVRTSPSTNARVIDCIPNGTQINTMGSVNGFTRLSRNRYVAARWVSGTSGGRPINPGPGVGGTVTLSFGSRGPAVSAVQRALGVQPTGYYGAVTVRRVRQFQANNGLRTDGVVGPQTRNALFRGSQQPIGGPVTLSFGSRGSAVSAVQRALGVEPTGYYGEVTVRRVREFQANNGLRVDGVVGPQTRSAIFRS
ncbi:peptidoglycan-binding protein [Anabaena subtropica]|uniref:Peptidoglycan-binding protein n=1 Tax=Anabaena subtropica FACHB-260 TaxID=2692884 RepID=A0ABR8CS46_9NOST|nr:peptidoglycan-binding protein [Anabaena subtropica]MBD2346021.1 peptidoglycan-binding protein [Anabaena subtropica FACHB-260]